MNRHFYVCFVISFVVPVLGLPIAWVLGRWYEDKYPSPDKEQDLRDNLYGALAGQAAGLLFWTIFIERHLA
jgi:hypothetical protein